MLHVHNKLMLVLGPETWAQISQNLKTGKVCDRKHEMHAFFPNMDLITAFVTTFIQSFYNTVSV
jgi:hypothetical protein